MESRIFFTAEKKSDVLLSLRTYQRQYKIEKGRPAVEQDGQECSDSGEKQAHIPAHNNPQGLQDLREEKAEYQN